MTRQRRRDPVSDASNLFRATPAMVLLLSTHAAGLARADDGDGPPARSDDADAGTGGELVRGGAASRTDPASGAAAGAGRLVVPLDLAESSDSAFVRRLLLSHGIELDLGESGTLDRAAFVALVQRLRTEGAGALIGADGADIDVGQVPEEAFDLTLAVEVDEELSYLAADEADGWRRHRFLLEGVIFPEPEGVPDPTPADPVPPAPDPDAVADCPVPQALIDGFAATFDGAPPDAADLALHARLHEALAPSLEALPAAEPVGGVSPDWRLRWLGCPIVLPTPRAAGTPPPPRPLPPPPVVEPDVPADAAPEAGDAGDPEGTDAPGGNPGGSLFSFSDELPPGFEGLGGPVDRLVDVYLNDRQVGTTGITVTIDEFEFDAVDEVVAMLAEVPDITPLLPVLGAPMPTNAARRCYAPGDPQGCGRVETDTVAALYDENALRLDLFVDPSLLPAADTGPRYLDAPERRPSAILSLGLVASDTPSSSALDGVGGVLVGYGATHLSASADYTSRGDRSRLREARLTHFAGDYEYGLGSFGFSPGAGLAGTDLLGASVATSWQLRSDRERAFAAELVVYLQRRSLVRLLVDDRVHHAATYPAGNQAIDTSALPDGTYELEIRIGEGPESRTETRLYTKSGSIPPPGQTVLALTAGRPLFFGGRSPADGPDTSPDVGPDGGPVTGTTAAPGDVVAASLGDDRFLPTVGTTNVFGASAARRLTDRDALRIGVLRVGDVTVGQAEYLRLGRRYALEAGASAGGRGVLALGVGGQVFADGWSASLAHAATRADADLPTDPDHGVAFARFFPTDGDRTDLAVVRSFGRSQVGARISRTGAGRGADRETDVQHTLFARRTLFRTATLDGALEADWTRGDGVGSRVGVRLRVNARRDPVGVTAYAGASRVDDGRWGPSAGAGVTTGGRVLETVRWGAGARVDADPDSRQLGVSARLEHPWFAAAASTDWTEDDGVDAFRSSVASVRAQAGIDARGAAVGGVDYATAGVIVDVSGSPRGEVFDIRIGGRSAGSGRVGSTQFIALQPFRAYRVELVPRGVLSNGIGERTHEFTLFPGSVQRIDVEARREVLLIASLSDERGRAVADATFATDRGPVLIDASGVFQAELPPGRTFTVRRDGAPVCEFTVPDAPGDESILIPERPIPCRTAPPSPPAAGEGSELQ